MYVVSILCCINGHYINFEYSNARYSLMTLFFSINARLSYGFGKAKCYSSFISTACLEFKQLYYYISSQIINLFLCQLNIVSTITISTCDYMNSLLSFTQRPRPGTVDYMLFIVVVVVADLYILYFILTFILYSMSTAIINIR
jgi:hypothetical protein